MLQVAILNHSNVVTPTALEQAVAALNVQLVRDFAPAWGIYAQVYVQNSPRIGQPVLYVLDNATIAGALGYHDEMLSSPEGFVFAGTAKQYGVPWESVMSHECLEMLADPWTNTLVDTIYQGQETLVFAEVADPVEGDGYLIDGMVMSNFVLPTWFLPWPVSGTPHVDFLRRLTAPLTVDAGGYFSYTQQIGQWQQVFGDKYKKEIHDPKFSRPARRRPRFAKKT